MNTKEMSKFIKTAAAAAVGIVALASGGAWGQTTCNATFCSTDWYYNNTSASTFDIYNAKDLAGLAYLVNNGYSDFSGKTIRLQDKINLSAHGSGSSYNGGKGWIPIGVKSPYDRPFRGNFNGRGNTIGGLYINDDGLDYAGLFGYVEGTRPQNIQHGILRSVAIEDMNITAGRYVGGVAGYVLNGNVQDRCYSMGTISGADYVGGVVGYIEVGAGSDPNNNGRIFTCFSTSNVNSTGNYTGGVVGYSTGNVERCYYVTGNITGKSYVGGVAGHVSGNVQNCYSTSGVTGTGDFVGGIVGYTGGNIGICYATGDISGNSYVGGLAGGIAVSKTITNSAALSGSITGSTSVKLIGGNYTDNLPTDNNAIYESISLKIGGDPPVIDHTGFEEVTPESLYDDLGTIGERFINTSIWATRCGYLPGFTTSGPVLTPSHLESATATCGIVEIYIYPNQSKVFGQPNPVYEYSYYVYKENSAGQEVVIENVTLVGALSRRPGESVGLYPIFNPASPDLSRVRVDGIGRYDYEYYCGSSRDDASVFRITDFDLTPCNFTITHKIINVTITPGQTKVYGSPDPATFASTISNDAHILTGKLERTSGEPVGQYPINIGSLAVTNLNYAINLTNPGEPFEITKKPIIVTILPGQGKEYSDPAVPDPDIEYTVSNNSDMLLPASKLTRSDAANHDVGVYDILGTLALTPAAAPNYEIVYKPDGGEVFTIRPKAITVTVTPGQGRVACAPEPDTFAYVSSDPAAAFTGALEREAGDGVGVYAITQGTLAAVGARYVIAQVVGSGFEISACPVVTVTVTPGQGKVYGEADPPAFGYTLDPPGVPMTDAALVREPGEDAGPYPIRLGDFKAVGYYETRLGGDTIFTIAPKPVTVTVVPGQGKRFGNPDPDTLAYTVTPGLVTGDAFTGRLERGAGEAVGSYTIRQGSLLLSDNYDVTFIEAEFAISPKTPVAVTAITVAQKTFDGTREAEITAITAVGEDGVVFELGVHYTITALFDDANAGENKDVTVAAMLIPAASTADYEFSLPAYTFGGQRIDKREGADVSVPVVADSGYFTITVYEPSLITPPPHNFQTVEYAVSKDPAAAPGSLDWQDSPVLLREADGGAWYVYARAKEDMNHFAGAEKRGAEVGVGKFVPVDSITGLPDSILLRDTLDLGIADLFGSASTYKNIVWSVSATRSTGAKIVGGSALTTETAGTGRIRVTATVPGGAGWDYAANVPADFVRHFDITVVRPEFEAVTGNFAVGWVTVGPNPARRSSGKLTLHRRGRHVERGTLTVYDRVGNTVSTVVVRDDIMMSEDDSRVIGAWDMTNGKGRRVGCGVYLLRGELRYSGGGTEKVSIRFGVGE